jgi:5-aminopentanamidase
MAERIRVAGVQMDVTPHGTQRMLGRIIEFVEETHRHGAVLTVFPECTTTGYCFDNRDDAQPYCDSVPGRATEQIVEVCRRLSVFVVFGLLETDHCLYRPLCQTYNSSVLVGPEGVLGCYRKLHLPHMGVDRFTTPGNRPLAVYDVAGMRVGLSIGYDCEFPETARALALASADLIVLPTNWPTGCENTAEYVPNARALENHVYYLSVNRVGSEKEWTFDRRGTNEFDLDIDYWGTKEGFDFIGNSRFCDPHGKTITYEPYARETILYGDVDIELARNKHDVRVPKRYELDRLADRRPEMYGLVAEQPEDPVVRDAKREKELYKKILEDRGLRERRFLEAGPSWMDEVPD